VSHRLSASTSINHCFAKMARQGPARFGRVAMAHHAPATLAVAVRADDGTNSGATLRHDNPSDPDRTRIWLPL
jgi:hypothetical protein